jgi:hypothetical protein
MRRASWVALLAGLATVAGLAAPVQAEAKDHPLFLGVGLGGGAISIQPTGAAGLDRTFVAGLLHIGYQLTPAWRAGLDVHGGTFSVGSDWLSTTHVSLATASFFPDAPGGFYLKAGLGIGYLNTTYARTHVGLDVLGAVGWERHLGEQFAAGVEAWYAFTRYSDGRAADGALAATFAYRL